MEAKKEGYKKLTEFREELQKITLEHLQTSMPTVDNQWLKKNISTFTKKIKEDENHPLYSQLEIIQFINATLTELQVYLKELEFSRDPSTRKLGIQFLKEILNAIQIICTPHAEEQTIAINRKDYRIKGLKGSTSIYTFWLVESPTEFAINLERFCSKWNKFGVAKIIADLDPKFSQRAIKEEEKNKKDMRSQEETGQLQTTVVSVSAAAPPSPPRPSPNPLTVIPSDSSSDAELSEGKKKQKITATADKNSDSDAVVSEGKDNSSSSEVQQDEPESSSEDEKDINNTLTSGSTAVIADLNDHKKTQPTEEAKEEESVSSSEEESDEVSRADTFKAKSSISLRTNDDKTNSALNHDTAANQARISDDEADDEDEYTYEDYSVDEDEEESSVVTEESKHEVKVALPDVQKNDQQRSRLIQDQANSIPKEGAGKETSKDKKKSKKTMTPIKRRYKGSDGESVEEEIYEEILSKEGESSSEGEGETESDKNQASEHLTPEEAEANLADLRDEVQSLMVTVEEAKNSVVQATPPGTPGNGEPPLKGLSVIKKSNPALFGRLQRLSMDRKSFSASTETPTEAEEAHQKKKSPEQSPMSALLGSTEKFLKSRPTSDSNGGNNFAGVDDENTGDSEDKDQGKTATRALNFGSSESDTE